MVSTIQYELSHRFESGMTMKEFADACNTTYTNIYVRKEQFERLGIVFRSDRKPYKLENPASKHKFNRGSRANLDDAPVIYIKVKDGTFKGATGYIESMTDTVNAVLWHGGKQTTVKLETCEYDEIKKAV